MADTTFLEQLRRALPALLREHPEVRHEVWGIMLEAFPSRQEFMALLDEMRAMREDSNRRFEEMRQEMNQRFKEMRQEMNQRFETVDQRFEAVDHRFEMVIGELREMRVHLSALGGRVGHGLEEAIRGVVEEFAGHAFPVAERLVLRDEAGEVFGIAGAEVEFDLYAHNGEAYVVEVKSHLKPGDVLIFHKKMQFAREKLGREFIPLVLALSMDPRAEHQLRNLGIRYRIRAVVSG
jgi:hypothetical protein